MKCLFLLMVWWVSGAIASSHDLVWSGIRQDNRTLVSQLVDDPDFAINAYNQNGETPLAYAVLQDREKILEILLTHPAVQLDKPLCHRPCTPLFIAATEGRYQCVQLLLAAGANPNAANRKGTTPLLAALKMEQYALVPLLLAYHADPLRGDSRGVTPLRLMLQRYREHSGFWYRLFFCFEHSRRIVPIKRTIELLMVYGAREYHGWQPELEELFPDHLVRAVVMRDYAALGALKLTPGKYEYGRAILYTLAQPMMLAPFLDFLVFRVAPFKPVAIGGRAFTPAAFLRAHWLSHRQGGRAELEVIELCWFLGVMLRYRLLRKCLPVLPDEVVWLVVQHFYRIDTAMLRCIESSFQGVPLLGEPQEDQAPVAEED